MTEHKHNWKIKGERLEQTFLFILLECDDENCQTKETHLVRR